MKSLMTPLGLPEPDAAKYPPGETMVGCRPVRVGILACSKTKGPHACAAIELYRGRVFRAALAVLRARGCDRFVVLSALHGAISGDQWVAPYGLALRDLRAPARRAWEARTRAALVELLDGDEALAILPADYWRAIAGLPMVTRLFGGLSRGRLFQALAKVIA